MKVVFFGTPVFVIPILEVLENNFDIVGIVTTPNSPIEVVYKPKIFSTDSVELKELKPDLFVVAAYGKIIPKGLLEIPKFGSLNIHPSLLPKYRGASPIQQTILNGDSETGVTIIKMDERIDHGPIVYQSKITVPKDCTFESLASVLFKLAADNLVEVIKKFTSGGLVEVEQNHVIASYCNKIAKEDGYFDIANPPAPEVLERMIRAFYPWPGVWTRFRPGSSGHKIVKFYPQQIVQMEGKKPTLLKNFLNGYPDFPINTTYS